MSQQPTLIGLIDHLRKMFGLRNAMHHDSRSDLIDILEYGQYELDQVFAGKTERTYEVSLASLFALTVAILDDFSRVERSIGRSVSEMLIEVLSKKYPGFCLYCNKPGICECPETKRPKPNWKKRLTVPSHYERSLSDWQLAWKQTYGEKNQMRGLEANIAAVSAEAREVRRVRILFAPTHMASQEILENYLEELADFIARLSAVASLDQVNVDLGEAVWMRYGAGCPKCKKLVCLCTLHHSGLREYYRPVDVHTSTLPSNKTGR